MPPASNQLVDGAAMRAAVNSATWAWRTSDPGTGTIANNQIITWANFKSYLATNGSSEFPNNQCLNYGTFDSYKIYAAAPTITGISNASFCDRTGVVPGDPGNPVQQVSVTWTNSNSSYSIQGQYSTDGTNYNGSQTFSLGTTSGVFPVDPGNPVYFRLVYAWSNGMQISPFSNVVTVTVATLNC